MNFKPHLVTVVIFRVAFSGQSIAFSIQPFGRGAAKELFCWQGASTVEDDLIDAGDLPERRVSIHFSRSHFLRSAFIVAAFPYMANAANLPQSNGADLSRTGSIKTLVPIVQMRRNMLVAKSLLSQDNQHHASDIVSPETCAALIKELSRTIPREEKQFKCIFDAYSTPVSYKQKFLDQNAFLVYYSKGFDGPGRPSIESYGEDDTNRVQTLQYGFRNDAWNAIDDLFTELDFGSRSSGDDSISGKDLGDLIDKALMAFDSYLSFAPESDVTEATRQIDGTT
ncbi:hypothetical protein HJC23_011281 [Cyclotella cryptica]|uniref:Uncharacterized protein n=1 Tax=Cyclotella cryptica TaxID=29204 RepID=A0ABD3QVV3_9STRA|eukprot:CCRYP_001668-RA/>CCRYP_001668-RA protein AED:0.10 eAED:-0.12 QI:0/-1/0/1/-1/1/1/0/281